MQGNSNRLEQWRDFFDAAHSEGKIDDQVFNSIRNLIFYAEKLEAKPAQPELPLEGGDGPKNPKGPDWEGFGKEVIEEWFDKVLEGSDLQELGEEYRIIRKIEGGFNPDIHTDYEGYLEEGDDYYEYNFKW